MFVIPPLVIAAMACLVCLFLLRRLYHKPTLELAVVLSVRAYVAMFYTVATLVNLDDAERSILGRWGYFIWLFVELVFNFRRTIYFVRLMDWLSVRLSKLLRRGHDD